MVYSKIQDKEGIPPDHALLVLDLAAANKRQSSDGGESKHMLEIDTSDRNKVQGSIQSVQTPVLFIHATVSRGSEPRLKLDAHPKNSSNPKLQTLNHQEDSKGLAAKTRKPD
jgi:hypothetical protein